MTFSGDSNFYLRNGHRRPLLQQCPCRGLDPVADAFHRQVIAVNAKWIFYFLRNHFQTRQDVKHKHHKGDNQKMQTENIADRKGKAINKDELLDE